MPETLLSPSNILLFGQVISDLEVGEPQESAAADREVKVATNHRLDALSTLLVPVDGVPVVEGDEVLVKDQGNSRVDGVYTVAAEGVPWVRDTAIIGRTIVGPQGAWSPLG